MPMLCTLGAHAGALSGCPGCTIAARSRWPPLRLASSPTTRRLERGEEESAASQHVVLPGLSRRAWRRARTRVVCLLGNRGAKRSENVQTRSQGSGPAARRETGSALLEAGRDVHASGPWLPRQEESPHCARSAGGKRACLRSAPALPFPASDALAPGRSDRRRGRRVNQRFGRRASGVCAAQTHASGLRSSCRLRGAGSGPRGCSRTPAARQAGSPQPWRLLREGPPDCRGWCVLAMLGSEPISHPPAVPRHVGVRRVLDRFARRQQREGYVLCRGLCCAPAPVV